MRTGKKRFRRIAAMVCALALCASMLPTAVFADPETDAGTVDSITLDESSTPDVTEPDTTPENDPQNDADDSQNKEPEITNDNVEEPGNTDAETDKQTDETTGEGNSNGTVDTTVNQQDNTAEENPGTPADTDTPENENVPNGVMLYSMEDVAATNAPESRDGKQVVVATDGTAENFYADPDKMIWLSVSGGTEIAGQGTNEQNVTFTINIDGNQAAVVEVQGLARYNAQLRINAANYDFTAKSSQTLTYCTWEEIQDCYLLSNHNLLGDNHYSYDVTIDLTTPTLKDNDAIRIEDEANDVYYGTFFWAKGTATSSDYERPLEVYVNDELAYTTTVETPELLTAGSASYWFEANLANYTSNVTLDPSGSLDNVTQKTLKVYLTTKCACGNDNCQCSGGCDCQPGCTCPECNPAQGENEIVTPYGTIRYDPNAGDKRSLQVEIYVNGQKEYATDEPLTVTNATVNGFGFTANETKGYYFESQAMTVNSYDILVRDNADDDWEYVRDQEGKDGSSWDTVSNNIKLIYDKDYMVRIYLYTFDSYMTLVVTPMPDAADYVQGYTISYQARDPETGEEKTYTYPATSFAAGQPQIVPYGRKVTLTADCLPNYEATTWCAHRSATDLEFIGEGGNNGSDITPQYAYGNTIWFTAYGTSDQQVQISIDGVKEIKAPTDDEMQQLLGSTAVKVDCTTKEEHSDKTYALKADSYDKAEQLGGNSVDNYTYTITVHPDAYLTDYNTAYPGHSDAEPASQQIVFEYVAGAWTVQTETPVTFSVTCDDDEPTTPPAPTVKEIGSQVKVICNNTTVSHGGKDYGLLGTADTDYTIGAVTRNADGVYECVITVKSAAPYLAEYNKVYTGSHTLVAGCQDEQSFTMQYENGSWKLKAPAAGEESYTHKTGVLYTVTCPDATQSAADITIQPEDLTIYMGGETNYTANKVNIVDGDGNIIEQTDGSLPEIGFSLRLSKELNEKLRTALGVDENAVLDLSGHVTLHATEEGTGNKLTWTLEKYGDSDGTSYTDANGYFIYKIVPQGTGAKLNVSFYDRENNKYVGTDSFTLTDSLYKTYEMEIYGSRIDPDSLTADITIGDDTQTGYSVAGSEDNAELTVRYAENDATASAALVNEASEAEDGNPSSKLQDAHMIYGANGGTFMINDSNVQVDAQNVSLLFDDIADTASTNFSTALKSEAVDAVKDAFAGVNTSAQQTEAKYLDLVDATNGNVLVKAKQNVTIYWPFPDGTDASTTFYVAHFDGLDRNTSVEAMEGLLKGTTPTVTKVEADQYGIHFETKDFSPYVLVWDTTKTQPTTPDDGNDNNNDNTTTTTTTTTSTTNVTVNNNTTAASAPAAASASSAAIPQTGDALPVGLLGGVAAAAAAAFAALFVLRKRKRND